MQQPTSTKMNITTLYSLLEQNKDNKALMSDLLKLDLTLLNSRIFGDGTMLIRATRKKHVEIVKELIHLGADLNQTDCSNTALILAIFHNLPEIAELLILAKCDIHITDNVGKKAYDYLSNITDATSQEKIRKLLNYTPEVKPQARSQLMLLRKLYLTTQQM